MSSGEAGILMFTLSFIGALIFLLFGLEETRNE